MSAAATAEVVERQHPNVLSVGDVLLLDGEAKVRVVDMRPRDFFLVAPCGRRDLAYGMEPVFWADVVRQPD